MPTAIIIGFEYSSSKFLSNKVLSGTFFDLYRVHKWCQSCNYQQIIATDISEVREIGSLSDSVSSGNVDRGVITFSPWSMERTWIVKTADRMIDFLSSVPQPDGNRLLIYYSGHGESREMVLPNGDKIPFSVVRDKIHEKISPDTEVFWIIDSCESGNLDLPYQVVANNFVLQDVDKCKFLKQRTMVISATAANEKSISSRYGSIFTKKLLSVLERLDSETTLIERNRNISRLTGEISSHLRTLNTGHHHKITFWSSYIDNPILWFWVGRQEWNIKEAISKDTTILLILSGNQRLALDKQ